MNRRNFLSLAALAIAGKAAERVFPFRVYSIPKKVGIFSAFDPALHVISSYDMQLLAGTPPALFGLDAEYEKTATAALMRYQSAVSRDMTLYGSGTITPEMFRRAQKQIMDRLGASPLEINSYPLL